MQKLQGKRQRIREPSIMKNLRKKLTSILLCLTLTLSMATNIAALAQHESPADDELGPSDPIATTAAGSF